MTKNFENAIVAALRQFLICYDTYQAASQQDPCDTCTSDNCQLPTCADTTIGTLNPNPFVPQEEQIVPTMPSVIMTPTACVEATPYNKVMNLLNDPRFTLRTATTVQEAAGVRSFEELVQFFEANEIYFTTATKRRTGERLVGLASRN